MNFSFLYQSVEVTKLIINGCYWASSLFANSRSKLITNTNSRVCHLIAKADSVLSLWRLNFYFHLNFKLALSAPCDEFFAGRTFADIVDVEVGSAWGVAEQIQRHCSALGCSWLLPVAVTLSPAFQCLEKGTSGDALQQVENEQWGRKYAVIEKKLI